MSEVAQSMRLLAPVRLLSFAGFASGEVFEKMACLCSDQLFDVRLLLHCDNGGRCPALIEAEINL